MCLCNHVKGLHGCGWLHWSGLTLTYGWQSDWFRNCGGYCDDISLVCCTLPLSVSPSSLHLLGGGPTHPTGGNTAAVAPLLAAMLFAAVTVLLDAATVWMLPLYVSACGCCSHGWAPKGPTRSTLVSDPLGPTVADSDSI